MANALKQSLLSSGEEGCLAKKRATTMVGRLTPKLEPDSLNPQLSTPLSVKHGDCLDLPFDFCDYFWYPSTRKQLPSLDPKP